MEALRSSLAAIKKPPTEESFLLSSAETTGKPARSTKKIRAAG
jgi:hypothetical protein